MSQSVRPTIFIGSSSEGLGTARAIQLNLDRAAEIILWTQGVFGLGEGTLESLINRIEAFDFAILVLSADDLTVSRNHEHLTPRDNVIFELGLFIGALGRNRTFIVCDRTANIKLPTDLAGIRTATFHPPNTASLQSAVGPCCTEIQEAIELNGIRRRHQSDSQIDPGSEFRIVAGLLDVPAKQVFILMHEAGTSLLREGPYMIGMRYEYTIGSQGINGAGHGYFKVGDFCNRLADANLLTIDLRGLVGLTSRGHAFAEWLIAAQHRASYFWSDAGTWGTRPANLKVSHPSKGPRNLFEFHDLARAPKRSKKPLTRKTKK